MSQMDILFDNLAIAMPQNHREKPLVLVVDDDAVMRMLLRRLLEKDGYLIEQCSDGTAALAAFESLQPDLVLLDAMMPDMDGFEVCRQLRAIPQGQTVPILMVTALNDDISVDQAFEVGATDFIIKPIHRAVVRQRVRYLLQAQQAASALRENHARYRDLFEESPMPLWEEDFSEVKRYLEQLRAQGVADFAAYFETHPESVSHCVNLLKVIDVNRASLELYQAASKAELVEKFPQIFSPDSLPTVREELTAMAENKTDFAGEVVNFTVTGQKLNIKIRWRVASGFEDSYARVLVSLVDVTAQRRMEQSLLAAQKLADLGTLAAGVAHEINSPLQVITGVSQNLLSRTERGEIEHDYLCRKLDVIHRNGWRCAEIVRSLKTYAHTAPTKIESHNLNTLVEDTLLLIGHQLANWSNIEVVTCLLPELPPLSCDRNQISQILINLLNNARDAMLEGGEITVSTDYNEAERLIILKIADSGTGIPEAIRLKIFDPFFTTKPVGQGTGLGLFIVYGLVQTYGGFIDLETAVGQGSTFSLYFPQDGTPPSGPPTTAPLGRFDDIDYKIPTPS